MPVYPVGSKGDLKNTLIDPLDQLIAHAHRLPFVQVAKRRGLVLAFAMAEGTDVTRPILAMVRASRNGRDHHPWVQVYRIAEDVQRSLPAQDGRTGGRDGAPHI